MDTLRRVKWGHIISNQTTYGIIWSGHWNDLNCVVKMVVLDYPVPSNSINDKTPPFYHRQFIGLKPLSERKFRQEVKSQTKLAELDLAPRVYSWCTLTTCGIHYGFIIMERWDNSLKDILKIRIPNSYEQMLVQSLIYHLHKVAVHGDLKPSNIGVNLDPVSRQISQVCVLDCQKVQFTQTGDQSSDIQNFWKHYFDNLGLELSI